MNSPIPAMALLTYVVMIAMMQNESKEFLNREETGRIIPRSHFLLKCAAFVDFNRSITRHPDCVSFERPRRGTFKIDAILIEPATMAWAFELLLGLEPVGRAAQMGAHTLE